MSNKLHELLAPAGNYEKALYALDCGADAIYIGPKAYSLRARASNFEIDEIKSITEYAHSQNKKVYVVLNILCHNVHLKNFPNYFKQISDCKVDGIICADSFIISQISEIDKNMEIHVSTQQSITNSKSALFWKRNNATRVVLAREVNYENLKMISNKLKDIIEIEFFIHGAVCISYSGRCTMSNNFSFRDANIGGCAHSCRWLYNIENEDIKNKFTMSAKDMALIYDIEKLLDLDIASFKIEGRMKSIYYIASIVSAYRKAINQYKLDKIVSDKTKLEVKKAENRQTSTACFYNSNFEQMLYDDHDKEVKQCFAFIVLEKINDYYIIECKNNFNKEMNFECISFSHDPFEFKILEIKDEEGNNLDIANKPSKKYYIKIDNNELSKKDIVRWI